MADSGEEKFLSQAEVLTLEKLAQDLERQKYEEMMKKFQDEVEAAPRGDDDPVAHTQALKLSELLPPQMYNELKRLDLKNTPLRTRILTQLRALISQSKKK